MTTHLSAQLNRVSVYDKSECPVKQWQLPITLNTQLNGVAIIQLKKHQYAQINRGAVDEKNAQENGLAANDNT